MFAMRKSAICVMSRPQNFLNDARQIFLKSLAKTTVKWYITKKHINLTSNVP